MESPHQQDSEYPDQLCIHAKCNLLSKLIQDHMDKVNYMMPR
jgi:hypothetical protein